jgi:hypothetical protein
VSGFGLRACGLEPQASGLEAPKPLAAASCLLAGTGPRNKQPGAVEPPRVVGPAGIREEDYIPPVLRVAAVPVTPPMPPTDWLVADDTPVPEPATGTPTLLPTGASWTVS